MRIMERAKLISKAIRWHTQACRALSEARCGDPVSFLARNFSDETLVVLVECDLHLIYNPEPDKEQK